MRVRLKLGIRLGSLIISPVKCFTKISPWKRVGILVCRYSSHPTVEKAEIHYCSRFFSILIIFCYHFYYYWKDFSTILVMEFSSWIDRVVLYYRIPSGIEVADRFVSVSWRCGVGSTRLSINWNLAHFHRRSSPP